VMAKLPPFTASGVLPIGDYELNFNEVRASHLVVGDGSDHHWDTGWRRSLVDYAEILVNQLWHVGVADVFLDGSFVENKCHPNDIDGYFHCDAREIATGSLEDRLNQLDPHKVWTWKNASRRPYRGYPKGQLPMWHVYRVELWPHYHQVSGIADNRGNELLFPSAFRRQRQSFEPKGIVKLVREGSK